MSFSYDKSNIKLLTAVNSLQFIPGLGFCIDIYIYIYIYIYMSMCVRVCISVSLVAQW